MTLVATLLIVLSPVVLIMGLIWPSLVVFKMGRPTRTKAGAFALCMFLLGSAAVGIMYGRAGWMPLNEQFWVGTPDNFVSPLPKPERDFIGIIFAAQPQYEATANELQKSNIKVDMTRAAMASIEGTGNGNVKDWFGTISKIGKNSDGDIFIVIRIADGIALSTAEDSASEMLVDVTTVIKQGTPLYAAVAKMAKGHPVRFDALLLVFDNRHESEMVSSPDVWTEFKRIESYR